MVIVPAGDEVVVDISAFMDMSTRVRIGEDVVAVALGGCVGVGPVLEIVSFGSMFVLSAGEGGRGCLVCEEERRGGVKMRGEAEGGGRREGSLFDQCGTLLVTVLRRLRACINRTFSCSPAQRRRRLLLHIASGQGRETTPCC